MSPEAEAVFLWLKDAGNPEKAAFLQGFFKTGPGNRLSEVIPEVFEALIEIVDIWQNFFDDPSPPREFNGVAGMPDGIRLRSIGKKFGLASPKRATEPFTRLGSRQAGTMLGTDHLIGHGHRGFRLNQCSHSIEDNPLELL